MADDYPWGTGDDADHGRTPTTRRGGIRPGEYTDITYEGGGGQARDSRGRYTSPKRIRPRAISEEGANRGDQTFTVDRFVIEGGDVTLNAATYKHWLAQPQILALVEDRTLALERDANMLAETKNAMYGSIVYNNRPELGPVGVVYCDNYASVIDDAYHSTLSKILAGADGDYDPDWEEKQNMLLENGDDGYGDDGYGDSWERMDYESNW